MTRALRIATLCAVATALCAGACKKDAPKPSQAFEVWLQAVEKCDATAMRAGMTKTSIEQVEQLMKQLQAFVPEEKRGKFDLLTELCKGYRKGAITVQGETIAANGTDAMLKLMSDGKPIEAPMSFEDNAWKLDFAALMKQSLAAAAGARAPSTPPAAAPATPDPAAPAPAPAAPAAAPAAPAPAPAATP